MRRLLALLLVATAGLAHAGTLSCSRTWEQRNSNLFKVVAIGTCTMSSSYATGGDTFIGGGTPVQNAGQVLCGQNYDVPVFVSMNTEVSSSGTLMFGYDYTNQTIAAYAPTHSSSGVSGTITSLSTLTATATGASATFAGTPTQPTGSVTNNVVTLGGALTGTNTVPSFTGSAAAVAGTNGAVSCSLPNDGLTPDGVVTYKSNAWSYSAAAGAPVSVAGCAAPSFTGSNFTPAGTVSAPSWSSNWPSTASAALASGAVLLDSYTPAGGINVVNPDVSVDASGATGTVSVQAQDSLPGEEVPATANLAALGARFRYLAYCN